MDLVGQRVEEKARSSPVCCVLAVLYPQMDQLCLKCTVLTNTSRFFRDHYLIWTGDGLNPKLYFLMVAQFNNRNWLWKTFLKDPILQQIHCCSLGLFVLKRNTSRFQPSIRVWFLLTKLKALFLSWTVFTSDQEKAIQIRVECLVFLWLDEDEFKIITRTILEHQELAVTLFLPWS